MRTLSIALAALLAGGLFASPNDARSETVNPLAGFGEQLRQFDMRGDAKSGAPGYDRVRPAQGLPGVFGNNTADPAPVQMAQSSDAAFRVNQLEEQVRMLNGKIEEMTFQMLQLQEEIRKMQENNEFRFQELEDQSARKRKGNSVAGGGSLGKPQPSDDNGTIGGVTSGGSEGGTLPADRKTITELLEGDGSQLGAPPSSLGTLTFDADGNLIDSNVGKPIDLTGQGTARASLPEEENELYNLGYSYVQGGDYELAAETFREFVTRFPGSTRDQEARFWLGESLFAQGDYEASARIFLENHQSNPSAPLAPQNLMKLGVSLAGMEQRELACATLAEVPKKYPSLSNAVRKRVEVEQAAAKCKNG